MNGALKNLPYSGAPLVDIYRNQAYIVFTSSIFTLSFDSDQLLKLNYCGSPIVPLCGICGNNDGDAANDGVIDLYKVSDPENNCFPIRVLET